MRVGFWFCCAWWVLSLPAWGQAWQAAGEAPIPLPPAPPPPAVADPPSEPPLTLPGTFGPTIPTEPPEESTSSPLDDFPDIQSISLDIRLDDSAASELPPDPADKLFALLPSPSPRRTTWVPTQFSWAATEFWHWPLYFDDVQLERYGQMRHPLLQPALSGVHFFGTIPILPYKMGIDRPFDSIATLGYYRPGSHTPVVGRWLPLEADAATFEGLTWMALIFALP
jgi:hypothetical protein